MVLMISPNDFEHKVYLCSFGAPTANKCIAMKSGNGTITLLIFQFMIKYIKNFRLSLSYTLHLVQM